ncbi:hypothetical protein BGX38DRAFT_1182492, partial [Terfezia claveryi]
MKGFRKQSIRINNHITVTGGTNTTVNNVVGNLTQVTGPADDGGDKLGENQGSLDVESSGSVSLPPPPPYERAKQPTHDRKRKVPQQREREPSSSASPAPLPKRLRRTSIPPPRITTPLLPGQQQPIRQQLLHLRETSLRDIAAANASIRPQLQQSLKLLDGLRQFTLTQLAFIEQAMGEVERQSKRCADLAEQVDRKVEGLIKDPVLVGDDYMLTEQDETEPEGEGEREGKRERNGSDSPPPLPPLDEGFRFGSSPPPLVWLARQGYGGTED